MLLYQYCFPTQHFPIAVTDHVLRFRRCNACSPDESKVQRDSVIVKRVVGLHYCTSPHNREVFLFLLQSLRVKTLVPVTFSAVSLSLFTNPLLIPGRVCTATNQEIPRAASGLASSAGSRCNFRLLGQRVQPCLGTCPNNNIHLLILQGHPTTDAEPLYQLDHLGRLVLLKAESR